MRIRSDEMDGFTRIYDGIRYLILFSSEKLDAIYNRVRNLISQKRGTAYLFSHNYVKIKTDSYDSLPREKALTLMLYSSLSQFSKFLKELMLKKE